MSGTSREVHLHGTPAADPGIGPALNAVFTRVLVSPAGVQWSALAGGDGDPLSTDNFTTDGIVPSTLDTESVNTAANLRALNAAGNLDRLRTLASDSDNQAAAQLGLLGSVARQQLFDGATWDRARSLASSTDAQAAAQDGLAGVVARPYIFNGASFDRQRAPVSFATVSATAAGDTAIVAGVGGQQIRLLRYIVQLTADATLAAAGIEVVTLRNAAVSLGLAHSFAVPAAAAANAFGADATGWIDLGPIGTVLNVANALNVNLGTALTAGACRVTVAFIQGATT